MAPQLVPRPPPLSGHLASIDALRGLAALSVCLFHFSGHAFAKGSAAALVFSHGNLGVEVFFVISGFVIPHMLWSRRARMADIPAFLSGRFLRLYPTYLCALLLYVALNSICARVPGFRGPPLNYAPSYLLANAALAFGGLGLPQIVLVAWTLAIEAVYYPLAALALPWITSKRPWLRAATPAAWIAAGLAPSWLAIIHFLPFFGLGIAAFQIRNGMVSRGTFLTLVAAGGMVAWHTFGAAAALAGVASCLYAMAAPRIRSRTLLGLGSISYSLYLVHLAVGGKVMNLAGRLHPGNAGWAVAMAVALAASIGAAIVLHRLVEAPSQTWSRRIRFGSPKASEALGPEPAAVGQNAA